MLRYQAPPTNAQFVAFFGSPRPVAPYDYVYFSSDSDAAVIQSLLAQIPGVSNIVAYDGANGPFPQDVFTFSGPIGALVPGTIYGDDGRRVNCFYCDYQNPNGGPTVKLEICVGVLMANRGYGLATYNMGEAPPYTKLIVKEIKNEVEDDIEVVWSH